MQAIEATPTDLSSREAAELHTMLLQGRSWSGRERNVAFLNVGRGSFADASAAMQLDYPDDGRAVCLTDWDRDGDLDLWIVNRSSPQVRFLRNETNDDGGVLIRLQGRCCNRFGVGARVSTTIRGPRGDVRVRHHSVRAGRGYLAQSTFLVHIARSKGETVEDVTVRWPCGTSERFAGAWEHPRHLLAEGTGKPQALPSPTHVPSTPQGLERCDAEDRVSRLYSWSRPNLVSLAYDHPTKGPQTLGSDESSSRWICIWASWCRGCVDELREFASQRPALVSLGILPVALCTEQADGEPRSNPSRAQEIMGALDWPGEWGFITKRSLELLEVQLNALLGRERPLVVPTSLLVTADGRIAAIYAGRLTLERLKHDSPLLRASIEDARAAAVPFPANWHSGIEVHANRQIGEMLFKRGHADESTRFLQSAQLERPNDPPTLAVLGALHMTGGRFLPAIDCFRKAIQNSPFDAVLYHNLGLAMYAQGRKKDAESYLTSASALSPGYAQPHLALARVYRDSGRLGDAAQECQTALKKAPSSVDAHFSYALVLVHQGKDAEARDALDRGLRYDDRHVESWASLGLVLARLEDPVRSIIAFERALALDPNHEIARRKVSELRQRERQK